MTICIDTVDLLLVVSAASLLYGVMSIISEKAREREEKKKADMGKRQSAITDFP